MPIWSNVIILTSFLLRFYIIFYHQLAIWSLVCSPEQKYNFAMQRSKTMKYVIISGLHLRYPSSIFIKTPRASCLARIKNPEITHYEYWDLFELVRAGIFHTIYLSVFTEKYFSIKTISLSYLNLKEKTSMNYDESSLQ